MPGSLNAGVDQHFVIERGLQLLQAHVKTLSGRPWQLLPNLLQSLPSERFDGLKSHRVGQAAGMRHNLQEVDFLRVRAA